MKQLINKFLKEQEYSKGQIYKVCPDVLLNDFIKFVDADKKETIREMKEQFKKK